ncbi:MAG: hypothetical protein HY817_05010 [Candidatus Abawacabacteria bacterium]|nr:hypothetical protein [Candidatus Abawacabacteria bacterium]
MSEAQRQGPDNGPNPETTAKRRELAAFNNVLQSDNWDNRDRSDYYNKLQFTAKDMVDGETVDPADKAHVMNYLAHKLVRTRSERVSPTEGMDSSVKRAFDSAAIQIAPLYERLKPKFSPLARDLAKSRLEMRLIGPGVDKDFLEIHGGAVINFRRAAVDVQRSAIDSLTFARECLSFAEQIIDTTDTILTIIADSPGLPLERRRKYDRVNETGQQIVAELISLADQYSTGSSRESIGQIFEKIR